MCEPCNPAQYIFCNETNFGCFSKVEECMDTCLGPNGFFQTEVEDAENFQCQYNFEAGIEITCEYVYTRTFIQTRVHGSYILCLNFGIHFQLRRNLGYGQLLRRCMCKHGSCGRNRVLARCNYFCFALHHSRLLGSQQEQAERRKRVRT